MAKPKTFLTCAHCGAQEFKLVTKITGQVARLYHGTYAEYAARCRFGQPMPPTWDYIPGEWEGEGTWLTSELVWLTDNPDYARFFGPIVLVVEVKTERVEYRGRPCGHHEFVAVCWDCRPVGIVTSRKCN